MKSKILFFSIIILFSITSCVKDIYVETPNNDPKLVVNSYISPESDSINVWVSKSTPLYHIYDQNNAQFISNASVQISSENSGWVDIPFDANKNFYSIPINNFPISSGKKYAIKVSANSYNTVTSEITIPTYDNINFRYYKFENKVTEWGDTTQFITYKFNDPAGVNNYYAFKAVIYQYDEINNYTNYISLYTENSDWIMSDKVFDGKETSITFSGWGLHSGDSVNILVMQTDDNFFKFHYSLNNYSGDSPFTEAVPIYTNIQNGLGVFAGYASRKFVFVIP